MVMALVASSAWGRSEGRKIPARDPNQLSIILSDFDGTFAFNLGHYVVKRADFPGMPGLGVYRNLPDEIAIPVHDWEGDVGPRIRDRLGHYVWNSNGSNRFVPSASLDEITLSNGQKIIPAYYYRDPVSTFREFMAVAHPADGHLNQLLTQKLESTEPFLLESAPFVGATFADEYKDRLKGGFLTMRADTPGLLLLAHRLRDHFQWGTRNWESEAVIALNDPTYSEFGRSKGRAVREIYQSLTQRMMVIKDTPHFLVILENDRHHLGELHKVMSGLSTNGVFMNPVVPILVNLVEPEVFAHPGGIDWDQSRLETPDKMYRVSVYWGNQIETTDNLARVFELVLSQTPEQATATYRRYVNPYWCRDLLLNDVQRAKKRGKS